MAINQQASNLVDTTVNAFNGNVTSISLLDGISLIDSWVSVLRDADSDTHSIGDMLHQLKTELQSGNPNGSQIQSLLEGLLDQTKTISKSAETDVRTKLTALIDALDGFSQQLAGSAGPANTGGQAPMTSTVGGESTNSGTGVGMDDTTGSNAQVSSGNDDDYSQNAPTQGRSQY